MPKRYAPKKSSQNFVIGITFFVLLSIPLVIYGTTQSSFDTRNKAFDELELDEENPCLISIPNVNPYSLEVGKTIRVMVSAKFDDAGIESLQITDSSGLNIYKETFTTAPMDLATTFQFTPTKSGVVDMLGIVTKVGGESVGCKISSPFDVKGLRAIPTNNSPEFETSPNQSKPSQEIKTGVTYEYTLSAIDADKDRINYSYSFTPRADWLTASVIDDGSDGKLTIVFKGSTTKPASYLAHVLIHDGYSKHVRSQSWVISVSPETNDIPIVKIVQPTESLRLNIGTTFKVGWQSADLNHIAKYQLFMAPNPADESTWLAVEKSIPYNMSSYNVNTSSIPAGTYNVVVKATDNQTPANTGMAVSPEIVLSRSGGSQQTPIDDEVVLGEPQITNMSPLSTDKITNKRVTLKATIIASTNAQINESSIRFRLDGIDVTNSVKINKISKAEYTLIYQPEENLSSGQHKAEISFQDSASKSATKSWTFTITSEEDTSDIFTIFGYQIPKKTIIIVLVGILIVIIALIAPFIISSVWKEGTRATTGESYRGNPSLPHSALSGGSMYDSSTLQSETNSAVEEFKNLVNQKAITQEPSQNNKDIWNDNFFAPEPISNEAQDQPQVEQPIVENVIPQEEVKQEDEDIPIKQEEEVQQVPVAQDQPQVEQPIAENVIPQEEVKQEEKDIPIKQEEEVQQVPVTQDQPQVEQPITENVIPQEEVKQGDEDIPIKQEEEGQQVPVAQDQPQVEQPIVENTLPQEEVVEQVPLEQPQIPEPEIPSSSDLQKIFEQIPNQEDTNSPTAP
ncbi:MAG TPA: hypothetical protein PLD77_01195 [Candidatus Dojkabacteria bacterium]|nr:hypothetical protein [Candidatus Dojkabacteria bacterium]